MQRIQSPARDRLEAAHNIGFYQGSAFVFTAGHRGTVLAVITDKPNRRDALPGVDVDRQCRALTGDLQRYRRGGWAGLTDRMLYRNAVRADDVACAVDHHLWRV